MNADTPTAVVKERPILFSGAMVRAILEGRKTQTRRVVRMHADLHADKDLVPTADGMDLHYDEYPEEGVIGITCPYGKPGERLWVRETWGDPWHHAQPSTFYRATDEEKVGWHPEFDGWSPSIHMKRERSRITLEVVKVRVERLNDISEEDAIAEGVTGRREGSDLDAYWISARESYRELWESINGADSWDKNLWVWVVEFKRVVGA